MVGLRAQGISVDTLDAASTVFWHCETISSLAASAAALTASAQNVGARPDFQGMNGCVVLEAPVLRVSRMRSMAEHLS